MENNVKFTITLSIRKAPKGEQICYKVDGTRFAESSRTVKLQSESMYRVDLSFKPPQILESANIQGIAVEYEEKSRDNTAAAYSLVWSTDRNPVTKHGSRDIVPVQAKLRDVGEIRMTLQAKFYKQDDNQHAEWGSTFHCVEYECEINENCNFINVVNETFR